MWLLCACRVRRIKDLLRVCLSFYPFASVFALLLSFCLSFSLFAPVVLWLSSFFALFLFVGCCFLFPFGLYVQKERARRVGASSLVLLWVALFGCCFVLCELVRTQSVNIVTKFYIKIFAAGAANFFALACVLTCVVVNLSCFSFHIYCV